MGSVQSQLIEISTSLVLNYKNIKASSQQGTSSMMGRCGHGSLKRKAAGFQKSHTPWNKGPVYQHNTETVRSPQNKKKKNNQKAYLPGI